MIYMSYDVFSRKDVTFGGYADIGNYVKSVKSPPPKPLILERKYAFFRQTRKNIQTYIFETNA